MTPPIYIVSGVPGSGKTTVARALAMRYPGAVHIEVDTLRLMVVSGLASALDGWSAEHTLQFILSWRSAASMAARYADAGFVVVIDDVLREEDLRAHFYREIGDRRVCRVLLKPTLAAALQRNRTRDTKDFDTTRLIAIIKRLYNSLAAETSGWAVIDTTALSPEQTVEKIVAAYGGAGAGVPKY